MGCNWLAELGGNLGWTTTPRHLTSVAVGGAGMYEAYCRSCFVPHADAPQYTRGEDHRHPNVIQSITFLRGANFFQILPVIAG